MSVDARENITVENALLKLTESEIAFICDLISIKEIRKFFTKNSQLFNKIKSGYRVTALSDKELVRLVYKNISEKRINSFIGGFISWKMKEIDEFCQSLEAKGNHHTIAIMMTLSQSLFQDNVELYYKLCSEEESEDFIRLATVTVSVIREKEKQEKQLAEIKDASAEMEDLHIQVSDLSGQNIQLRQTLANFEEDSIRVHALNDELTLQMHQLKEQLSQTQTEKQQLADQMKTIKSELERLNSLYRFADEEKPHVFSDEYEHISVCRVCTDWNGDRKLQRIADISQGNIIPFVKDETRPHYFDNRDMLYWKNGPSEKGAIGIWQWNADENRTSPGRDYITTSYVEKASLIEVIEFQDCHSFEDLASMITSRVFPVATIDKMLAVYRDNDEHVKGLYCRKHDFDISGENATLRSDIFTLPEYEISETDIISIGSRTVYAYMSVGMPNGLIQVRNPMIRVKEIVLSRATLSALRNHEITKKEAQNCQSFLKSIPDQTLYDEVMKAFSCDLDEAKQYISSFIEYADSYLSKTDVDVSTLSAAIERSNVIQNRCKELLTEEWKVENADQFARAKHNLDKVSEQLNKKEEDIKAIKSEMKALEQKKTDIQSEIESKYRLAEDVEANVKERIEKAKHNAAQFISDMAFSHFSPQQEAPIQSAPLLSKKSVDCVKGYEINDDEDFAEALSDNLMAIGYNEKTAFDMSEVITTAIKLRSPIVCGTNALHIAECVAAMFNDSVYSAFLRMGQESCQRLCDEIIKLSEKSPRTILINGAFDGLSLNHYNELLMRLEPYKDRVIVVLALGGIPCRMIPKTVWSQTLYLDGDEGYVGYTSQFMIQRCQVNAALKLHVTEDDIKKSRRELRQFEELIDNRALYRYAVLMAETDCGIRDKSVLSQLILHIASVGSKEKTIEQLVSFGIEEECYKGMLNNL